MEIKLKPSKTGTPRLGVMTMMVHIVFLPLLIVLGRGRQDITLNQRLWSKVLQR